MFFALILVLLFSSSADAAESLCDMIKLPNCESVSRMARRSSAKSFPTTSSAGQFNPANVSHDRGFGTEVFFQDGNSPNFSLVTGTGRSGAGLVSTKVENAFFGNRIPELDENFLIRSEKKRQYDSKKYALALSVALFKNKNFSLDLGVIGKYHTEIKRLNPGGGLSARAGIFSLAAASYQDDFFYEFKSLIDQTTGLPYATGFNRLSYQERFQVQTLSAGIKLWDLYLDYGQIKTHYEFYDDDSLVKIMSASFIWNKFLFTYAMRDEDTPGLKYVNGQLKAQDNLKTSYAGIQYSLAKFFVIGVHHNYYLLNEYSLSTALFF